MSCVSRCAASLFSVATFVFCATAFAADEGGSTLSPRQLYYKPPAKTTTVRRTPKPPTSVPDSGPNTGANPTTVVPAPPSTASEPPNLGLRYSVLNSEGQEIDASQVFHSGDRIRLKLQSNSDAYVYVINQSPGGELSALFPSAQIVHNNNMVERDRPVEIPAGQNFFFKKDETGIEKLIVVVSREPEPDMERLVNSLKQERSNSAPIKQLEARNHPPSGEIDRLRSKLASRSIGVEPVHKDARGKGEEAVYVAVSDPSNSRIITEIALKHE